MSNFNRRDFLRIALAGGAAAFIPIEMLEATSETEGHTKIWIEGCREGNVIRITSPEPDSKVLQEHTVCKTTDEFCINVPLKWGEVCVHRISTTVAELTIGSHLPGHQVPGHSVPMKVHFAASVIEEIDHDRKPKGKSAEKVTEISIGGLKTRLGENWELLPGDTFSEAMEKFSK